MKRYQWREDGMFESEWGAAIWVRLDEYKAMDKRRQQTDQHCRELMDFNAEAKDEITDLKRVITKLGNRLNRVNQVNRMLAAHNLTLVTLMADRGINCERIIRGDQAEAKLERIRALAGSIRDKEYLLDEILEVLDAE